MLHAWEAQCHIELGIVVLPCRRLISATVCTKHDVNDWVGDTAETRRGGAGAKSQQSSGGPPSVLSGAGSEHRHWPTQLICY